MSIAISLPCEACVHLPVCAIAPLVRDALVPYRAAELVGPIRAITVETHIDVHCEHFLRDAPAWATAVAEPAPNIPAPSLVLPGSSPLPGVMLDLTVAEPHDAIPAALTDGAGEASGAPSEPVMALDGGSVKPAGIPTCDVCAATFGSLAGLMQHRKHAHTLTVLQTRVIDALRAHDGVGTEADRAIGKQSGYVRATVSAIAAKGLLPADVAALMAKHARPLKPTKTEPGPADSRLQLLSATERQSVREVADRIKAREAAAAAAPPPESLPETFEERRARFARERVAASRASY